MKLKYYLRGIGIGIIVTTLILMAALAVHREQPLSDDEIIERARSLGMVMADELPVKDKLSDTELSETEAMGQEAATEDADNNGQDPDEPQREEPDASDVSKEEPGDRDEKPQKETVEQAEITIVGGEYSDAVCKKLKTAGVIEDADDFNKYLAKTGYDNLIQPGNYVIPLDADYDAIIKIITEKKTTKKR